MPYSLPNRTINYCNFLIEYGLIFLVVFMPLAFGAPEVWAYSVCITIVFALGSIWFLKSICIKFLEKRRVLHLPEKPNRIAANKNKTSTTRNQFESIYLIYTLLFLFGILIVFQMIPLTPSVLKKISPNHFLLYQETISGYGTNSPERELNEEDQLYRKFGFLYGNTNPRDLRSISPNRDATVTAFLKFLSVVTLLLIVIHNFRFDPFLAESPLKKPLSLIQPQLVTEFRVSYQIPINRIFNIIIYIGIFVSILGLLQQITGTSKIYWLVDASHGVPYGTYVNRNHFAGYINLIIPLFFAKVIIKQIEFGKYQTKRKSLMTVIKDWLLTLDTWLQRIGIMILMLILIIISLIASASKGGLISFLLSAILFYGLFIFVNKQRKLSMAIKVATGLLVIITIAFQWADTKKVYDRLKKLDKIEHHIEYSGRVQAIITTWKMANDFWLTGIGLGNYQNFYQIYRKQPKIISLLTYGQAHSDHLQVFAETGIAGLLLVILFLLVYYRLTLSACIKTILLERRIISVAGISSITSMNFHSFVDFNMQILGNALLYSLVMGMTYISSRG